MGIPSAQLPNLQRLFSCAAASAHPLPLDAKCESLLLVQRVVRVAKIEGVLCQRLSVSLLPAVSWTPEHDCPGPSDE